MSAVIGALRVNLGLNSAEFQKNLKKSNKGMNRFAKRAGVAMAGAATAISAGLAVMTRQSLSTIDMQAKLAQSLGTTTKSMQIMERAGDLSGVAMSGVEQASKDLQRRLSQAADGTGPAVTALKRLGLTASDLMKLPLDQRIKVINEAIAEFIPVSRQAAVAGQLFGEEGSLAISRINPEAIQQATSDIERFGVAVSEVDAANIERTNDALSQIKLITKGLGNQLAVVLAPTLEKIANGLASISEVGGPVNKTFHLLLDNVGRITAYAVGAATVLSVGLVGGFAAATIGAFSFAGALVFLKFAIIRTGIGALVILIGEGVYQFTKLVKGAGGFGAALDLMKGVAVEVWDRIGFSVDAYRLRFKSMTMLIKTWWLDALNFMGMKWADLVDKIAPTFNKITDGFGLDLTIETMGIRSWASAMEHASITQKGFAQDAKDAAIILEGLAGRPLKSVQALRDAMLNVGDGLDPDQANRLADALDNVNDELDDTNSAAGKVAETFQEKLGSAIDSVSQAFGNWVVNGFKDFKEFVNSVINSFKSMIAQMIATAAKNKILISLGLGGSGVAGAVSGGGLLGGLGSTLLGGFGSAGVAGTGLLGGLGGVGAGVSAGFASGGLGGALSGFAGATASGISSGIAAGGIAGIGSAIGAALPIIGIGLALFSLFKKKPAISGADFAKIQQGLELTGVALLGTGRAGKNTAAALKKAAGGMEEFQKQTQFYFDNFFTDTEKREKALEALSGVFGGLNLTMPKTAQGFRDIVESLDLTTKSGQSAYSELLKVAPVFSSVFGSIANAGKSLSTQFGDDVFSTREQMNRTMAALNRGAEIGSLPHGSGVVNLGEVVTVTERMDQLQTETAAASMSSAQTLAQIRNFFTRWDNDGMPEVRLP